MFRIFHIAVLIFYVLLSFSAMAQDSLTTIKASSLSQTKDLLSAEGTVIIRAGNRELRSDHLEGNTKTGVFSATGNVFLRAENNDIISADHIIIKDDLQSWRADNARFSEHSENPFFIKAKRFDKEGDVYTAYESIATPCAICNEEKKPKTPLWSFSAEKIILEPQENTNRFFNTTLRLYGTPIFYTPYFSSAHDTNIAKSGLLEPVYGSHNRSLGNYFIQPLYLSLAPDKDFSVLPILSERKDPFFKGQYRQAFRTGRLSIDAAYAQDKTLEEDLYYARLNYRHNFSKNWNVRAIAHAINRPTFLRDFGLGLTSFSTIGSTPDEAIDRAVLEGITGRHYIVLEAEKSTDLRLTPVDQIDKKPSLYFSFSGNPENFYGRWSLSGQAARRDYNLSAQETHRFSGDFDYTASFYFKNISLNQDIGVRHDLWRDNEGLETASRTLPWSTTTLKQSWFYALGEHILFFEPTISYYAGPDDAKNDVIINEDTESYNPERASFFTGNRVKGYDIFETGHRLSTGIETGLISASGSQLVFFAGRSRRNGEDAALLQATGIDSGLSNPFYATTIALGQAQTTFNISLRTEKDSARITDMTLQTPFLNLSSSYQSIDEDTRRNIVASKDLTTEIRFFNQAWHLSSILEYDFLSEENSGLEERSTHLRYQGDCFYTSISFLEDFIENEKSFMISFGLGDLSVRAPL